MSTLPYWYGLMTGGAVVLAVCLSVLDLEVEGKLKFRSIICIVCAVANILLDMGKAGVI